MKSQSEEPTDKTDGSESADDTDSGQSMSEDNTSEKTDIFSLTPFKEGREDFIYSGAGRKDNIGNSYSTGYYITYDGLQNKNKEVCYLLDGKYKSLKGEIALDYVSKDVESEVWFEFYNGDKELGRTDSLCSGVKPVKVSIDVSQVDELTIRVNGGNQRSSILTEGFYLE